MNKQFLLLAIFILITCTFQKAKAQCTITELGTVSDGMGGTELDGASAVFIDRRN